MSEDIPQEQHTPQESPLPTNYSSPGAFPIDSSSPKPSYVLALPPTPPPSATTYKSRSSGKKNNGNKYSSLTPNTPGTASSSNGLMLFPPSQTIGESLISLASTTAARLEEVWDEVGYTPEERANQIADLLSEFRRLCEDRVTEEKAVADQYRRTIADAKEEIRVSCKALKTEVDPQLLQDNDLSLTDELATLEVALDLLRSAYSAAKADLVESREKIIAMHEALGSEPNTSWLDVSSDLTTKRREEFRNQVSEMEEVVATRKTAIIQLLLDCQQLMKEMCLDKDEEQLSDFDKKILSSLITNDEDTVTIRTSIETDYCTGISATTLDDLTKRVADLSREKRRRKVKLGEMGAEIALLWEKLRVSEEEQRAFTEGIKGLGLDTIEKGEKELERLYELKAKMIGKLIKEARETIATLWKETNANGEQRENFKAGQIDNESLFTDVLLAEHEEYIAKLNEKLEQMRPILRMIEKREDIIKERMEYEELQKDPDRFQHRGASLTKQLMKEEKMSRRIKKDLPKYTEVLENKLHVWESENGEPFFYQGESYLEVMIRQEEEWQTYKDNLSKKKLRKKQEEQAIEGVVSHGPFKPLPGKKKCIPLSSSNRPTSRCRSDSRSRALTDLHGRENRVQTKTQDANGKIRRRTEKSVSRFRDSMKENV